MAGTFRFELVSPERVLLSADAEDAMVPGIEGDFTVFAGHAPVISSLRPGFLEVTTTAGKRRIFVKSGFAEVTADAVTVLAETAFDVAEADGARISGEVAAAEAELVAAKDDEARMLAQTALDRLRTIGGKAA